MFEPVIRQAKLMAVDAVPFSGVGKVMAKVKAVNNSNEMSLYSKPVQATPAVVAPAKPTGLNVTSVSEDRVSLAWNANNEVNLKGYYVAYMPVGGSWFYKYTNIASCSVKGLTKGIIYTFKVKAVNNNNQMSAYSLPITAKPQ